MYQVLLFIYVVVAIALIGFILVQQGKGANAGASFGGGASGTMFGSAGAGNFLTRTSAILATAFFCYCSCFR
ncbi:preprotein translocase subunit SecG [Haemophilus influenzae PittII]|nr:preprotein translocase subunit SecG [Haemophilus influenzae PittII]